MIQPPAHILESFIYDSETLNLGTEELSEKYDKSGSTIRRYRQWIREEKPGLETETPELLLDPDVTHEYQKDAWNIVAKGVTISSEAELLAYFKIDTQIWEVVALKVGHWGMGYKDREKTAHTHPLFTIRAELRKIKGAEESQKRAEAYVQLAESHSPKYLPLNRNPVGSGNFLEYCAFDVHMGKDCWPEETGSRYDLAIAERLCDEAFNFVLGNSIWANLERIVMPIGNDLVHVDSRLNQTTAGTPQDVDTRYQKIFRTTLAMLVRQIDRAREIAPVDLIIIPGNHDYQTSFALGEALAAWYRLDPEVTVDNSASVRKFYTRGEVMILYTHGNEESRKVPLAGIAASEKPEIWAKTKFREAHVGHEHTKVELIDEATGFRTRKISSLSGTDKWHYGKGYIKNIRGTEGFIWNETRGLISQNFYNVNEGN